MRVDWRPASVARHIDPTNHRKRRQRHGAGLRGGGSGETVLAVLTERAARRPTAVATHLGFEAGGELAKRGCGGHVTIMVNYGHAVKQKV